MLARTRGFDGGVEREDVRLECDFVDDLDDFRDVRGRDVDGIHRLEHFLHVAIADFGLLARFLRELVRLVGVLGVAGRLRRDFRNRGRELLDGRCLLGRALRKRDARIRDVARACRHLVRRHVDFAHGLLEVLAHLLERGCELADFVVIEHRHGLRKVAIRDGVRTLLEAREALADHACEPEADEDGNDDDDDRACHHDNAVTRDLVAERRRLLRRALRADFCNLVKVRREVGTEVMDGLELRQIVHRSARLRLRLHERRARRAIGTEVFLQLLHRRFRRIALDDGLDGRDFLVNLLVLRRHLARDLLALRRIDAEQIARQTAARLAERFARLYGIECRLRVILVNALIRIIDIFDRVSRHENRDKHQNAHECDERDELRPDLDPLDSVHFSVPPFPALSAGAASSSAPSSAIASKSSASSSEKSFCQSSSRTTLSSDKRPTPLT